MKRTYYKGMLLWDPVTDQLLEIYNYVGCGLYLCKVSGFVNDDGDMVDLGYCPVNELALDTMEESGK